MGGEAGQYGRWPSLGGWTVPAAQTRTPNGPGALNKEIVQSHPWARIVIRGVAPRGPDAQRGQGQMKRGRQMKRLVYQVFAQRLGRARSPGSIHTGRMHPERPRCSRVAPQPLAQEARRPNAATLLMDVVFAAASAAQCQLRAVRIATCRGRKEKSGSKCLVLSVFAGPGEAARHRELHQNMSTGL